MAERADGCADVEFSGWWLSLATALLVALGWLAPSGLFLIGFLAVIIVAHEAGHLVMARRAGMVPTEFFWGFGPEIVAIQIGQTRYGVKALFLGGYVKLEGMTPTSTLPPGVAENATYRAASHRGRLATILAGPAVNIAMALIAFVLAAMLDGHGPAAAVALGAGDLWFVISGTAQALWLWVANIGGYMSALLDSSGSTAAPVRFLSPVAQADVSRQAVRLGLSTSLQWFAVLSCAIGALNLLPLPPLDGAHAVVAAAEGAMQRVRRDRTVTMDVTRLLPLAYVTVGVLVVLSLSALILDVRDLV